MAQIGGDKGGTKGETRGVTRMGEKNESAHFPHLFAGHWFRCEFDCGGDNGRIFEGNDLCPSLAFSLRRVGNELPRNSFADALEVRQRLGKFPAQVALNLS